jgi:TonB-linked SusC/RagA family outer membrane protein
MSRIFRLGTIAFIAALLPAAVRAQAATTGTIGGQVMSAEGQAIVGAQVSVVGTMRVAVTDQQGRYTINAVPVGAQRVRARMLGYAPSDQPATVTAGSTTAVNFQLTQSALQVGAIVITATGIEQQQREIGSSIGVIDMAEVPMAAITNTAQLIQGRVAGAVVLPSSGVSGTGSRIRIRGNNSMSLSNAPLIIVDGVRVESSENSLGFGVGGQAPSRLNDLNPEDIETVEVLKGPSASALYGTAAANGVIQVTTRKGKAGAPALRVWSEFGHLDQTATFPVNTYATGPTVTATNPNRGIDRCDIVRLAIGRTPTGTQVGCTGITQTYTFSPLTDTATNPFQYGRRSSMGASMSGGSEVATYYVSGGVERESGVLPQNQVRRNRVQANSSGHFGPAFKVSSTISYLDNNTELPISDNASFGILPMGLYGSAQPAAIETQKGFQSDPQFFYDWKTTQKYSRLTGSMNGDYRPLSWLSANATIGLDRYGREEVNRLPRNTAYTVFGSVYTHGFIQDFTYDIWDLTTNASATANARITNDLASTTAVGTSYLRERFHQIYAFGADLTPGVETSLAGAASDFDAGEANAVNATVSAYVQQQFSWRDRLFFNGAARGDQNTAFGTNIGWIWYPSVSGSWIVSDESFFPKPKGLDMLRLRAAYGQSGLRPGPTDALQSFGSSVAAVAGAGGIADAPAIVFGSIGNPELKPERSSELEAGFETSWVGNRVGLDFSYFSKHSTNALVSKPLPLSIGSSGSRFENLGRVDNTGYEITLRTLPIRTRSMTWELNFAGSTTKNELVDIGRDAQGNKIKPIIFGFTALSQRHQEGYPLGTYFSFPIDSFADKNADGLLSPSEVFVNRDTVKAYGNPFPKRELTTTTNLTFRDWLKVYALLGYSGGHQLFNFTHANRCDVAVSNCAELYDKTTPLATQANIVAMRQYGAYGGFVEDADFFKLREVALTFGLPRRFASRIRANALSLTLAGRNLKTWTDYTGLDPEVSSQGQANFTTVELGTLPPNRMFMIRFDANF